MRQQQEEEQQQQQQQPPPQQPQQPGDEQLEEKDEFDDSGGEDGDEKGRGVARNASTTTRFERSASSSSQRTLSVPPSGPPAVVGPSRRWKLQDLAPERSSRNLSVPPRGPFKRRWSLEDMSEGNFEVPQRRPGRRSSTVDVYLRKQEEAMRRTLSARSHLRDDASSSSDDEDPESRRLQRQQRRAEMIAELKRLYHSEETRVEEQQEDGLMSVTADERCLIMADRAYSQRVQEEAVDQEVLKPATTTRRRRQYLRFWSASPSTKGQKWGINRVSQRLAAMRRRTRVWRLGGSSFLLKADNMYFVLPCAFVFTACSGFTNALTLRGVLSSRGVASVATSHVSGTVTNLGFYVAYQKRSVTAPVAALLGFFGGASLSGLLTPTGQFDGQNWWKLATYGCVLLLVALLLLVAAALQALSISSLIAVVCAAAACGAQNGLFTTVTAAAIRTTHVTGITTDIGLIVGRAGARLLQRQVKPFPAVERRRLTLLSIIITGFFLGAACGGALVQHFGTARKREACLALAVPAFFQAVLGLLALAIAARDDDAQRSILKYLPDSLKPLCFPKNNPSSSSSEKNNDTPVVPLLLDEQRETAIADDDEDEDQDDYVELEVDIYIRPS